MSLRDIISKRAQLDQLNKLVVESELGHIDFVNAAHPLAVLVKAHKFYLIVVNRP